MQREFAWNGGGQLREDGASPPEGAGASDVCAARRRGLQLRQATAASLLAAFGGQAFLVISGVIVARLLGPENRGHLSLVIIIPAVLAQLVNLGLPQAVTYFVARETGAARDVVWRILLPASSQAVALVALHLLLLPVFMRGVSGDVWLAAWLNVATGPALLVQQYALALLQGQRRFLAFNVLRTLPTVVYSVGVLILLVFGVETLVFVATAWAGAFVLVSGTTLAVALRGLPPRSGPDVAGRREMVRFGIRGFLGAVSPLETFRIDQSVIALFLSPVALGLYVVALAFTNLPRFVAQSIGLVAYPHIASQTDRRAARRSVWRFFAVTLSACALVVLPLWAGAGVLVPMFFGSDFSDSVPVMRIMLIGSMCVAGRMILSDGMRGLGLPHFGSIGELISWAWLLPSMALFVPRWGIEGVALALATSSALSLTVLLILAVRNSWPAKRQRATGLQEVSLAAPE